MLFKALYSCGKKNRILQCKKLGARALGSTAVSQGSEFCRWDKPHGSKEPGILCSVIACSGLSVPRFLAVRQRWRVLHLTFWVVF